ncbi:hypothetical protein AUJ14_02300 [Candidatus Micrarchaeota archaeon CG1_02_55_22]|nr:MAG: hypothetical protein AUJ14_02300 [Candidatus Micrarchaeota archaeon CG1_02_55_22]
MKATELLTEKRTLVSFHSRGDIDAVASAIALSNLLPKSSYASPGELQSSAVRLLQSLGWPMPVVNSQTLQGFERLVLIDSSSRGHFDDPLLFESFKGEKLSIDHHYHSQRLKGFKFAIDRNASSCSEIVYEMYCKKSKKTPREIALLLACGLYADSGNFRSARTQSFHAFSELLKLANTDYETVRKLAGSLPSAEQRRVTLDAVAQCKRTNVGERLVCTSKAKGFGLACATALVASGCDAAFVASPDGRIAGAKNDLLERVNVGKIMEDAGNAVKGSGGGHENVGGCNGEPSLTEKGLRACVETFRRQVTRRAR